MVGRVVTCPPPNPFDPLVAVLESGELLYRVHSNRFASTEFNPGYGRSRFAFFTDADGAIVPVMYAAATQEAAVAETLLHDVPVTGGYLGYDDYSTKVMTRVRTTRRLRVATFHGLGLRQLKTDAADLTASPASTYDTTVLWSEAAHKAGLDGVVWMSRQCNDAKAYVFFGDRCADAIDQDLSFARIFEGPDVLWLIDLCAPLGVDVLPPC